MLLRSKCLYPIKFKFLFKYAEGVHEGSRLATNECQALLSCREGLIGLFSTCLDLYGIQRLRDHAARGGATHGCFYIQHCAGVESVALSSNGGTVFTASRDATVRSWQAHGEEAGPVGQWKGTYEGHSNWVNDVLTMEDRLVTCSSDHCVSLWSAHPEASGKTPCLIHGDIVT